MADRRKGSECPMNVQQVQEMQSTLKDLHTEVKAMRKMFIFGRAVLWTVSTIAVMFMWFFDRTDEIRSVMLKFLQSDK